MSRGGGRGWVLGCGAVLLVLLAGYALMRLEGEREGPEGRWNRSTHSARSGGYMILFRWLQALEVPIRRWEQDLTALPPEASVLLLAEPKMPPTRRELEALEGWVRGGGTLVLVTQRRGPILEGFGLDLEVGVKRGKGGILPCQPGPYTSGVNAMEGQGVPGLTSTRPETVFHLCGPSGRPLAVTPEGDGRVIAFCGPDLFSNRELREGDHARLALNLLLHHRGSGLLLVDEYHHGFGRVTSMMEHLGRSRAMPPLVQGVMALLIALALWGRRFGVARGEEREERHSSMEYVHSMGGLLRRARARGSALESVAQWVEEEARRGQLSEDRSLQVALRGARQRASGGGLTDRDLLNTVRSLYRTLETARRRGLATQR